MMIRTFGLKPKEAWEEYCVFDPQKKGVVTATDVFGAMALTADAKVNDNTLGSSIGGGRQQYSNSGWMTIMMMMMMMTAMILTIVGQLYDNNSHHHRHHDDD